MQVSKVGCVGKTCALAKLNDSSGGKKSKRRSKDERKGMVETFVKRHQASNDGTFPSLHLTHKEVGGSYYTVREIFRELIQENRVLAPPKLPAGEENTENLDSFLENNPLGSISFDPNVHGLPPKDNQTLVNEYKQNLDKEDLVNGTGSSDVTMENEEFVEAKCMEVVKGRVLEGDKDEIKVEPCEGQISHLSEDVVVEDFPLRPVFSIVHSVDEKANEKEVLDGDLELGTGNISIAVVDEKLLTSLEETTDENIASGSQYLGSNGSSSSLPHSTFEETTTYMKKSVDTIIIKNQTADAIIIKVSCESCEVTASKESVSEETNPIVSFMKTVVAAFVKFWSE